MSSSLQYLPSIPGGGNSTQGSMRGPALSGHGQGEVTGWSADSDPDSLNLLFPDPRNWFKEGGACDPIPTKGTSWKGKLPLAEGLQPRRWDVNLELLALMEMERHIFEHFNQPCSQSAYYNFQIYGPIHVFLCVCLKQFL